MVIIEALGNFGPAAKNAVPWLNDFLRPGLNSLIDAKPNDAIMFEWMYTIKALGKIGMNAQSVLVVEQFLPEAVQT